MSRIGRLHQDPRQGKVNAQPGLVCRSKAPRASWRRSSTASEGDLENGQVKGDRPTIGRSRPLPGLSRTLV